MRDKKDHATRELPGFGTADPVTAAVPTPEPRRPNPLRPRTSAPRQEQLALLDETDASGLPVWRHDEGTDLSGLPIWAAA